MSRSSSESWSFRKQTGPLAPDMLPDGLRGKVSEEEQKGLAFLTQRSLREKIHNVLTSMVQDDSSDPEEILRFVQQQQLKMNEFPRLFFRKDLSEDMLRQLLTSDGLREGHIAALGIHSSCSSEMLQTLLAHPLCTQRVVLIWLRYESCAQRMGMMLSTISSKMRDHVLLQTPITPLLYHVLEHAALLDTHVLDILVNNPNTDGRVFEKILMHPLCMEIHRVGMALHKSTPPHVVIRLFDHSFSSNTLFALFDIPSLSVDHPQRSLILEKFVAQKGCSTTLLHRAVDHPAVTDRVYTLLYYHPNSTRFLRTYIEKKRAVQ